MDEIASKNIDVWNTILNMPFTNDRKRKIELSFYSELIPDLYMSGLVPQLYLSAAQSTQHCLSGGMDESVIYSFSIMGLQIGEQGRVRAGVQVRGPGARTVGEIPEHVRRHPRDERDRMVQHAFEEPSEADRGLLPEVDPVREELRRPL